MNKPSESDELDWTDLAWQITCAAGESFTIRTREPVGGGCIHRALRLRGERQSYFLKLNHADCAGMFEAEALGCGAPACCACRSRSAGAGRVRRPTWCWNGWSSSRWAANRKPCWASSWPHSTA
jgi:hypothetical protein